MISATLYNDPACPWGYSENPALRVIEWRYGDQLQWRLALIGLTEDASQYERRGYTPVRGALGQLRFRRCHSLLSKSQSFAFNGHNKSEDESAILIIKTDSPEPAWLYLLPVSPRKM